MIELYTWGTPNGRKVSIMLEETGLPYRVHPIDINKDEQFHPSFLKISPNNKIPAIVDGDTGQSIFESGVILMYLAEKTGKFWDSQGADRWRTLEWLMWQMAGFGPILGQVHHFVQFNPGKARYAEARFTTEADRLYSVLDKRLGEAEYVAGDYSIADMAIFPWAARFGWQQVDLTEFPNVLRWYEAVAARPAVQRGFQVPAPGGEVPRPR